jgi:sterol desaturase/sphingolipid hydroxylase (fatty acid hydroxylase superfamily)
LVALDLVSYLWHRANHGVAWLWRFHRVHHTDDAYHVSTALRFHPGELLLGLPVRLAAIMLLGASAAGVLAFEAVFGIANVLEHGNFDLPVWLERRIDRVLVTPALHRRHHSVEQRERDTNFGTIFCVWDRLARTRRADTSASRFPTGLGTGANATARSLGVQLGLPLRRQLQDGRWKR